jgi:L-asparagine permease
MPGSPYTSIIGLVFLASIIVGLAITGWQSSPSFWHKTTFIVVVLGIPIIAVILGIGWLQVRPKVIANTGGRLKPVWSNDGPTYGPDRTDDDLYRNDNGVFGFNVPPLGPGRSVRMGLRPEVEVE